LEENAKRLDQVKETTNVACVITDIEGFTALSAKSSSERMLDLLGEYFGAILKPVADYGGFVSDLRGDSILAIWTDRTSDASVRERVCQACLELQAAVDRFNGSHPDSRMPTRIGVNYGVVTLATVGSSAHHMQYSAIGDTANTASRIEQLSKDLGTYLLVAAPMVEGLSQFLVRDLGEFSLRGRTTATRIVELLGQYSEASPEQIELCHRFFEAKKAFDSSDLRRAQIELQSLLKDFPEDGPSNYFLRIIERQL
jgi:adenylate cyclase